MTRKAVKVRLSYCFEIREVGRESTGFCVHRQGLRFHLVPFRNSFHIAPVRMTFSRNLPCEQGLRIDLIYITFSKNYFNYYSFL